MAKSRFSWDAFNDITVNALADAMDYDPEYADLDRREWLEKNFIRPKTALVKWGKEALEDTWLREYKGAKQIVEKLIDMNIGPLGRPRTQSGYLTYIRKCRNSKTLQNLLCKAMIRYGDMGPEATIDDHIRRFALLKISDQSEDDRKPYPHQKAAWDKLSAKLAAGEGNGGVQGLLVMPTGSGKTFTAVRWLVMNVINKGGKVLWIAHRHELLEQAALAFYNASFLATEKERIRVRIVSGQHCASTQIDPADDIILASVFSLARREDIAEMVLTDPDLFLVIDEAHHAPAKSYKNLILRHRAKGTSRIVGLTATPTRTTPGEVPILKDLFKGTIIHEVGTRALIEQNYLARPIPVQVGTRAEVEKGITEDDQAFLTRFHDLSPKWFDRIAHMTERNQVIVEHYLAKRKKYGKTLIFAINVVHAALLTEELCRNGINAEYIASYRPGGKSADNKEIINRFRQRSGGLDVLVNVMIMTEGVDVPAIKTVFLTRPTASEILVRQMIGRALRGPKAGGTKDAYLVTFEDHWERFPDWENPFDLVPDIFAIEPPTGTKPKPKPAFIDLLPWDLIQATAKQMRLLGPQYAADAFEAVPHGWYVLEHEQDDESDRKIIPVYKHQEPCWDALIEHLEPKSKRTLRNIQVDDLFYEFFYDCDIPSPGIQQVREMVEQFRSGEGRPEYHAFEERTLCDPYAIAEKIWDENLGARDKSALVKERYQIDLTRAVYPAQREFYAAIEDALYEIEHPEDSTRERQAVPIFGPLPDKNWRLVDTYDLDKMMKEVLKEGAGILGKKRVPFHGKIEWSRRCLKGWYGKAYYEPSDQPGQGKIRINALCNSPDITSQAVQFLLWHEYLHLYLQQGHTETFRELERKWPGCVDAEKELDSINERFGIQYW